MLFRSERIRDNDDFQMIHGASFVDHSHDRIRHRLANKLRQCLLANHVNLPRGPIAGLRHFTRTFSQDTVGAFAKAILHGMRQDARIGLNWIQS